MADQKVFRDNGAALRTRSPRAIGCTAAVASAGWFTPEQEAARAKAYDDMLVHRFEAKLPLSAIERKEARQIIKRRGDAQAGA